MSLEEDINREPEDYRSFLRSIFAEPKDKLRMRIFADYLEDTGLSDHADFWRWMADSDNQPFKPEGYNRYLFCNCKDNISPRICNKLRGWPYGNFLGDATKALYSHTEAGLILKLRNEWLEAVGSKQPPPAIAGH